MRVFPRLAAATCAALTGHTLAVPIIIHPVSANDLDITLQDTLNETISIIEAIKPASLPAAPSEELPISVYNNFKSDGIKVYVTGLDSNGEIVLLTPGGNWYTPPINSGARIPKEITEDIAIPIGPYGTTTSITLPAYVSSGRVWVADGDLSFFTVLAATGVLSLVQPSAVNSDDPSANVNWGFVELTTDSTGITVNLSYVDFIGLPLGIKLQGSGGTQTALGVTANALSSICAALTAQSYSDGQPWNELCMTDKKGNIVRVISPYDYTNLYPHAFSSYWMDYVSQVWSTYETTPLTIDTQSQAGLINCTVSNGVFTCSGDNRGYSKPVASDIFGCNNGTFAINTTDNAIHRAIVPRLCAAFDRSTLLLSGGNVQPRLNASFYYTKSPTNWYSKIIHEYAVDGKGYAFPYDDVTPDGALDVSGLLHDPNPTLLTITVGGPTS
ncbi:uncharacterized protein N7498_008387 [Penicillium cinerascens]|uniref:GH64 domain-containing protein n=1 Tax=Penicillium cinerascens TaxID=70096 RepID=A0A9W9MAR0_9EURO|nr:uncharacterized protein N7498_008387 [Penicillium cinerascens]KAJ5194949.1 hypothetical protein N7498_008387 [Penicillium cinerascens]